MVDLSKAKKGDKVKFRCGGEAVIQDRKANTLFFNGEPEQQACNWYWDGRFITMGRENIDHPFDITSIEPPAFDWSTVKAGMAFRHPTHGDILIYIGPHICRHGHQWDTNYFYNRHKDCVEWSGKAVERMEEHDIEVTP